MSGAAEIDDRIREAQALGDHDRAVTLVVQTYGRELLSFLIARAGPDRGNDIFSDVLESVWRGFPSFAWRSSLRTWLYTLSRNALSRDARRPHHKRETFATTNAFAQVAEQVRSETAAFMRTHSKDRLRELRAQLPDDDQTLMFLRIDRKLSWPDLAVVMGEPGAELSKEQLRTECGRLRTRFVRAKERLKHLAQTEGLLPDDE